MIEAKFVGRAVALGDGLVARGSLHCDIRCLGRTMFSKGWTRFHYRVRNCDGLPREPRLDDVLTPGYFTDATEMMAAGDMIDVSAPDGGMTLFVAEARSNPDFVRVVVMARTPPGPAPIAIRKFIPGNPGPAAPTETAA